MIEQSAIPIEEFESLPIGAGYTVPELTAQGEVRYPAANTNYALNVEAAKRDGVDPVDRFKGVLSRRSPAPALHPMLQRFMDFFADIDLDGSKAIKDGEALPATHLAFIKAGPGIGKTELAHVMKEATGATLHACTTTDSSEDLDSLILDFEQSPNRPVSLVDRINHALADKEPPQALIDRLKDEGVPLEAFTDFEGIEHYSLDRANMKKNWHQVAGSSEWQEDAFRSDSDRIKAHNELLKRIIEEEGINGEKHDFVSKNGPLLNALLSIKKDYEAHDGVTKPTIILLDEFNRVTDWGRQLVDFFNVVGGHAKRPFSLKDQDGAVHSFTPAMFRNVFIYATGNIPGQNGAHEMPEHIASRLAKDNVLTIDNKQLTAADYKHRLEQLVLGIPTALHQRAGMENGEQKHWDGPDGAAKMWEMLNEHSKLGLTQEQRNELESDLDFKGFLANGANVSNGLGKVAGFMHAATQLIEHPQGAMASELRNHPDELQFDLRMFKSLHDKAWVKPRDFISAMQAAVGAEITSEPISAKNFGEQLVAQIRTLVDRSFPERTDEAGRKTSDYPNARAAMYKLMYQYDIIDRDTLAQVVDDVNEMPETKTQSPDAMVASLINSDPGKYYADYTEMSKIIKEVLAVRDHESDPTITQARYGELMEQIDAQDNALMEGEKRQIGSHAYLPKTFSQIVVPNVRMAEDDADGVTLQLDLQAGTEIDAITRPEQIEGAFKAIGNSAQKLSAKADSLASTQEVMLGLLLTGHIHQAISAMFSQGVADAVEADIAQGNMAIRERVAQHNKDEDQKPRLQKLLDEAKERFSHAVSYLKKPSPQGFERTPILIPAEDIAENQHPSGLATTTLHTVGFDAAKAKHFDDALTVVNVQDTRSEAVNGDKVEGSDEMLVVGTSPLSAEFVAKLAEKHITYVCTQEAGAKEAIIKRLTTLHQLAKQQLQHLEGDNHPDLKEEQTSGLLLQLENAMNLRTSDAYDENNVQPAEGEDWQKFRLNRLADHMLDERCRTGEHAKLEHATRVTPVEHDGKVEELQLAV